MEFLFKDVILWLLTHKPCFLSGQVKLFQVKTLIVMLVVLMIEQRIGLFDLAIFTKTFHISLCCSFFNVGKHEDLLHISKLVQKL